MKRKISGLMVFVLTTPYAFAAQTTDPAEEAWLSFDKAVNNYCETMSDVISTVDATKSITDLNAFDKKFTKAINDGTARLQKKYSKELAKEMAWKAGSLSPKIVCSKAADAKTCEDSVELLYGMGEALSSKEPYDKYSFLLSTSVKAGCNTVKLGGVMAYASAMEKVDAPKAIANYESFYMSSQKNLNDTENVQEFKYFCGFLSKSQLKTGMQKLNAQRCGLKDRWLSDLSALEINSPIKWAYSKDAAADAAVRAAEADVRSKSPFFCSNTYAERENYIEAQKASTGCTRGAAKYIVQFGTNSEKTRAQSILTSFDRIDRSTKKDLEKFVAQMKADKSGILKTQYYNYAANHLSNMK